VDRLHLPFAAVAFSAVVSMMPGFFLFNAATGLVEFGLDRADRPGGSADEHCHERRHGISDHHGHDLRADPPAHAVRARNALSRMMRHDRSNAPPHRSRLAEALLYPMLIGRLAFLAGTIWSEL